ncbi:MAG: cell division protein ZapA [Halanaerobiaceae bacterium]
MVKEDKHKNRFTIKIMGEEMIIVGQLSEEYVKELAEHINQVSNEISRAYPRLSRHRIINLTILNIADEYKKNKDVYNKKMQEFKQLQNDYNQLQQKYNNIKKEYEEFLSLLEESD